MCHVLIIEDEPLVAMMIEDILAQAGATSFAFATTQMEAVDSARDRPPAVITSDVNLLEGTGPAAVAEIHGRFGETPVLFITGTPEGCWPCAPPGQILPKPINSAVLAQAFRDIAPRIVDPQYLSFLDFH